MHQTKDGVDFTPGMVLWYADDGRILDYCTDDWTLENGVWFAGPWHLIRQPENYYSSERACVRNMIYWEEVAHKRRMKELEACLEHPDCCSK